MFIIRAFTILVLTVLIFGGAAYFAYELYWKPERLDREEKVAAEARAALPPTPPPDYTLPAFEKAAQLQKSGDVEGARAAFFDFLKNYPDAPKASEARRIIGEINSSQFFSPSASPDKVAYTVVSRDSLAKIAAKFKSSPELIFRVNNLDSINLQIGQQLYIPQLQVTVDVDRKAGLVTVNNNGAFFKAYPAVVKVPHSATATQTKVLDKFATRDSKRVAFGDKNYADCERFVVFSGGVTVRAGEAGAAGAGITLSPSDMDEIFLLVNRGTPVTLH